MEKPSNKDARARASLSQPQGSGESRKPGYGSALAGGGGRRDEGGRDCDHIPARTTCGLVMVNRPARAWGAPQRSQTCVCALRLRVPRRQEERLLVGVGAVQCPRSASGRQALKNTDDADGNP